MVINCFAASVELIELNHDSQFIYEAKKLLKEYGDYMFKCLGLIAGKENFFKELEQFPTANYLPPLGIFIIAKVEDVIAGCVGIKKFDEDSCEMKRLFVHPALRGKGIGVLLCNYVFKYCRRKKYKRILLDTNLEMAEAISLYKKCGFKEINPYRVNENEHPIFMEYIVYFKIKI